MSPIRSLLGRPTYAFPEVERGHQLHMVRRSPEPAEIPPVPEGYELRQIRAGYEGPYEDLFHLAFADEGRFPETIGRALEGGFYIVEHLASSNLVSSCVALRGSNSPHHHDSGQLGWLLTDPSHVGKGLGTVVSACAMNRLATAGYKQPFLGTEDFRIAAISIYLKLGWHPYIYRDGMETRWGTVVDRLGRASGAPGTIEPTTRQPWHENATFG